MANKFDTKASLSERIERETEVSVAPSTLDLWHKRGYGPRRLKVGGRVLYPRGGPNGSDEFIADLRRQIAGEDEAAA